MCYRIYIPTWFIRLSLVQRKTLPVRYPAFINFYCFFRCRQVNVDSWSTYRAARREWRRRARQVYAPHQRENRSIPETETEEENDARGRSKNEGCFASHVWARTGVLGLRCAATLARARIIEWSLCAHLPGISIYLYIRLYTNAVYTTTITREIDRETLAHVNLRVARRLRI